MALSFAVLGIKVSKDRQKKMTGISHRLEGCTGQKVAAKRPTLYTFVGVGGDPDGLPDDSEAS
ncbi:MAG: hypothetical protein ACR2PX_21625, partial [Endozoicomonas sp.]|uniref:hypothetical protein n=1 Tax=Endozoicomonas sp. TaxID=1892382 RepID=UPI003D9B3EB8